MTTPTLSPRVDVRRADERFTTQIAWLDSKHSFSFGSHYDHDNTHHGLLLVNNDDVVTPGFGFETHPHRDMEIVTWVMQGSLVHQDSTGHNGVIYPGLAQRMSAGTGILHSEKNDSWRLQGGDAHRDPVHFVQMWVLPDEGGITPGYEQLEIDDALLIGGLVPVASGMAKHRGAAAISIRNRYAALYAARLQPGRTVELPEAPYLHLFVPRGTVTLEGAGELRAGDAVRFTGTGGLVPVASGMTKHRGAAAISIHNKYAALYAARLQPGQTVELPEAPFLHLFVPRGTVTLEGAGELRTGDAVRFTATGGQRVTATEAAEVLVWEMHATVAA